MIIFFVVFVFFPFRYSLASWNWVPSPSMLPTILEGELVFVDKRAYDLKMPYTNQKLITWAEPKRGDIITCHSPADDVYLVKRVIGIPGDVVEMRDNKLYINGVRLNYRPVEQDFDAYLPERYANQNSMAAEEIDGFDHIVMSLVNIQSAPPNFRAVMVPEGQYFVMGDNRDISRDSRIFGLVDYERIMGKARGVILSFDPESYYLPRWSRFGSSLYAEPE